MFRGCGTALVTPFKNNEIDFEALDRLIDNQLSNGIDALFVLGTTGEPATMTESERISVIKFALSKTKGKLPTYIGTGCNNTAKVVQDSLTAQELGADGLLVVTPYYNKCTQEGLYQHYKAVSDAVSIPMICYNVPGRTGVNMLPSTLVRLAELKNIEGVKEACGNMLQIIESARLLNGSGFNIYSGDDELALPILSVGGKGLISVMSNAIPAQMSEMVNSFLSNNTERCKELQFKYGELMKLMFCEVNPIPVKYCCSKLGLCGAEMRLPLTTLSEANQAKVEQEMKNLNLI